MSTNPLTQSLLQNYHNALALVRHTMHHHGELSLLSLQAGSPEGPWL